MIRVAIPFHLRTIAQVDGEVHLAVITRSVLDALEAAYPPLRGTIRHPIGPHVDRGLAEIA